MWISHSSSSLPSCWAYPSWDSPHVLRSDPWSKPLIQLQEAFGRAEAAHHLSPRLTDLEEEVHRLSATVNHLLEAQEFRDALQAPEEDSLLENGEEA